MSRAKADKGDLYPKEDALAEDLAYMLTEPVTTPARTIGVIVPTKVVWKIIADSLVKKVGRERFVTIREGYLQTPDGFMIEAIPASLSASACRGRKYDKLVYFEYDYPTRFLNAVKPCEVPPNA